jgi:23S rRNA (pseudouridine1915-N3)-methyltransferase
MQYSFVTSMPALCLARGRLDHALPFRKLASATRARWRAKLSVSVLNIGRHSSKDAAFDDQIAEYQRRLTPVLDLDLRWVRSGAALEAVLAAGAGGGSIVLLDGRGKAPRSSVAFSELLFDRLERGGSRLTYVIGDAEGLPSELISHALDPSAKPRIEMQSLSPLTLTHKMCRLFLCEQIYRASEIRRGSGYDK